MNRFDMKQEINHIQSELAAVETLFQAGEAHLRVTDDFGSRCSDLAVRLREMGTALPPNEPVPESIQVWVKVKEQQLRPASWMERAKNRLFRQGKVDDIGRVPQEVEVNRLATAIDPRWPGQEATTSVDGIVEVVDFVKAPSSKGGRGFRYVERRTQRRVSVAREAFPQDPESLRHVQEAYQRRQQELQSEVRDITGFIRQVGSEVAAQEQLTAQVQADTTALTERVAHLPVPPDTAGEVRQIEVHIREIRQGLAEMEQELTAGEDRLAKLKEQVNRVCPELQL